MGSLIILIQIYIAESGRHILTGGVHAGKTTDAIKDYAPVADTLDDVFAYIIPTLK